MFILPSLFPSVLSVMLPSLENLLYWKLISFPFCFSLLGSIVSSPFSLKSSSKSKDNPLHPHGDVLDADSRCWSLSEGSLSFVPSLFSLASSSSASSSKTFLRNCFIFFVVSGVLSFFLGALKLPLAEEWTFFKPMILAKSSSISFLRLLHPIISSQNKLYLPSSSSLLSFPSSHDSHLSMGSRTIFNAFFASSNSVANISKPPYAMRQPGIIGHGISTTPTAAVKPPVIPTVVRLSWSAALWFDWIMASATVLILVFCTIFPSTTSSTCWNTFSIFNLFSWSKSFDVSISILKSFIFSCNIFISLAE